MTSPDQDSFDPYPPPTAELRDAPRVVGATPAGLLNPATGAGKYGADPLRTVVAVDPDPQVMDTLRGLRRRFDQLDPRHVIEDNRLKVGAEWRRAVMTSPALPQTVAARIIAVHNTIGGLQLVLCDNTPRGIGNDTTLHQSLVDELVAAGIPADSIRFLRDSPSTADRNQLIEDCNTDRVSVLINPVARYRVDSGTYARIRIAALHHVDVPFRPDVLADRENTIRQADPTSPLQVYTYHAEGTPDTLMWSMWTEGGRPEARSDATAGHGHELDAGTQIHGLISASVGGAEPPQTPTDVAATPLVGELYDSPVQQDCANDPDFQ